MPHISATTVVVLMDSVEEIKKEGVKIDPLQGKNGHIPLSCCVISLGKTSLLRLCECAGVTSLQIPSRLSEQEYGSRSEDWHQVVNTSTLLQTFLVCHSCPSMLHIYFNRGNIHSVLCKQEKWTHSYWDEFVSLPAIVPHGPIAILGWWNSSTFDA